MVARPIWSTWAKYKKDIDANKAIDFAKNIVDNGFPEGQLEIDDFWEVKQFTCVYLNTYILMLIYFQTCYGSLTFNSDKFPSPGDTVAELKAMNFTVTLWTHPFVNDNCNEFATEGKEKGRSR